MRHGLLFLFTYTALVLDATGWDALAVGSVRPAWLLLAGMAALVLLDDWSAIIWAALAALLSECLKTGGLGAGALCAVAIAWLLRRTTLFRPGAPPWLIAGIGLPALFAMHVSGSLLSAILDQRPIAPAQTCLISLQTSMLTGATGLGLLAARRTIASLLPHRRRDSAGPINRWPMLTR